MKQTIQSRSEQDTEQLAQNLARFCLQNPEAWTIHLNGDLGAGKTCFSRGFIAGLGHQGSVKSPTYTLVEHYQLGGRAVFHFDLYRIADPDELELMGFYDYLHQAGICIVEWPEKLPGLIAQATWQVVIDLRDDGRDVTITACQPTA